MRSYDIVIVGAGVAGMSAAIGAKEAGCNSVLVIDSERTPGGILNQCLHNGFADRRTGPEYIRQVYQKFSDCGAEMMLGTEVIRLSENRRLTVTGGEGVEVITCERMILASGATEIPAGSINITGTRPEGVYTAGQVQKMINVMNKVPGKNAVIIGCGDLGAIIAGTLIQKGKNVLAIIEKQPEHAAMQRNYREYIVKNNITVLYNSTVDEIIGQKRAEGVILNDGSRISCDMVIIAVGLKPDTQLISHTENRSWIKLCGNCNRIYNMIEMAESDAKTTGIETAKEIFSARQL